VQVVAGTDKSHGGVDASGNSDDCTVCTANTSSAVDGVPGYDSPALASPIHVQSNPNHSSPMIFVPAAVTRYQAAREHCVPRERQLSQEAELKSMHNRLQWGLTDIVGPVEQEGEPGGVTSPGGLSRSLSLLSTD
jgi:hypothetical protein